MWGNLESKPQQQLRTCTEGPQPRSLDQSLETAEAPSWWPCGSRSRKASLVDQAAFPDPWSPGGSLKTSQSGAPGSHHGSAWRAGDSDCICLS